ncbi:MAG: FAD-dependent oxidoreductase, partial [Wenzhouxiangellaceae bacterium]
MIRDALGELPAEIEAEVCICGAGPAGIVLALELARQGRQVALIEGGGIDGPGDAGSVYEGETSGRTYPLAGSRLRWLGGTSNHWGGWVKPLDELDFRDKPHFPMPGWPFGPEELAPWYRAAAGWCELDSADFTLASLGPDAQDRLLALTPESGFSNRMFRVSPPTRFGSLYRDDLESSDRIECYVNLNAVELRQGDDSVRALVARTISGEQCQVRARHFVLAMGGIENARFLLNQQSMPGNHAGLVGRCFMDHYGYAPGKLLASANLGHERGALPNSDVFVVTSPNDQLVMGEKLRNSCILLRADAPDNLLAPDYWESRLLGGESGGMRALSMINEPLPHPESRISLGQQRDVLGLRRAHLHWHLPASEFDPVLKLFDFFVREISKSGLGRIRQTSNDAVEIGAHVGIGYHHMGTTRMDTDPRYGVV